jgi:hypothetical protein
VAASVLDVAGRSGMIRPRPQGALELAASSGNIDTTGCAAVGPWQLRSAACVLWCASRLLHSTNS